MKGNEGPCETAQLSQHSAECVCACWCLQIVWGTSLRGSDFLRPLSWRGPSPAASARSCTWTRHRSRSSRPWRPAHWPLSVGVGRCQSHIFLQVNGFTGRPGLHLSWLCFRLWCFFCLDRDSDKSVVSLDFQLFHNLNTSMDAMSNVCYYLTLSQNNI